MPEKKIGARLRAVWHVLLLGAGLALIVHRDLAERRNGIRREPTLAELKEIFTGSVNAAIIPNPIPHYQGAIAATPTDLPAAGVSTASLPPKVKGYVDEINALVVIDRTGAVRGLKIIASRETPSYLQRLLDSGYLDRFLGHNVREGFDDIDTVTGASITARAIRTDVAAAAITAARELYHLNVPEPDLPSWSAAFRDPRLLAVIAALVVALFARFSPWPARGRKEAAWIVSILLLGVYAMTPYSLGHTFQLLRLDLPGPGNAILAVLAGFVLVTTVLFGPLNCAYLCPFGALQEFLSQLPVKRWKVTPRIMGYARELRYLVLFITVAGAFGLGVAAFAEVEPFFHLFGRSRNPVAWLFIGVVLFTSVFVKRFWCRFFCPTGACLVILSTHRKLLRQIERGVDEAGIDRADEA